MNEMKKRMPLIIIAILCVALICVSMTACSASNNGITIINNNVDVYQLYEAYLEENQGASFYDFLESLSINYSDTEYAAEQAVKSAVSIRSTFTKTVNSWGQTTNFSSAGAGVVYKIQNNDVYIITNYHVVYDSESITTGKIAHTIKVYTYGHENSSEAVSALFVGGDMDNDIAILKAGKSSFKSEIKAVVVNDSSSIKLGQTVIAVGNPLDGGIAVTSGVISVVSESISMKALDSASRSVIIQVIRTDTAINPGNSGGGLFNVRGELIGIVNAKTVQSEVENMGYAIPSNTVIQIAENVIGG